MIYPLYDMEWLISCTIFVRDDAIYLYQYVYRIRWKYLNLFDVHVKLFAQLRRFGDGWFWFRGVSRLGSAPTVFFGFGNVQNVTTN